MSGEEDKKDERNGNYRDALKRGGRWEKNGISRDCRRRCSGKCSERGGNKKNEQNIFFENFSEKMFAV